MVQAWGKNLFGTRSRNSPVQTFWLNPTTGEPEPRPIYEVLSSHSARKAFAGNMYKNVKDPNLVCAITGHKEGSKAFKIELDLGSYAISLNP